MKREREAGKERRGLVRGALVLAIAAAAVATLSGCKLREGIPFWKFWQSSPSKQTSESKTQQAPQMEFPSNVQPPPEVSSAITPPIRSGLLQPTEHLRTVYFDYDSAVLTEEAKGILEQNAEWLREHPALDVQVEGHCDERGTVEYNFSLGQRRADAVRDFLVSHGINPDSIHTISYGEERPVDPGHDEEAWRKNRRVQFLIYQK
jgi:peptidoglycan-associated lipoprotein